MKCLKVNLWGSEIGRLIYEPSTRRISFMFNDRPKSPIPDVAPLMANTSKRFSRLPFYGDDRPLYQGLPPFIADSLPDSWGNTLFDKWVKDNKIPRNKITPLDKLMFIGTRGMGALEYDPSADELSHNHRVDIKGLYDLSLGILNGRKTIGIDSASQLNLQSLLSVGTSAGGRQMKAIIAINNATGEIRSGQTDGLEGYDYYILKFGDSSFPTAEIETAYYAMAIEAGIEMTECRLLPIEGINHFLTKRFDRKDGDKIHVQTLAAINPEARSYEDLIDTCRQLALPEAEIEQIFARLVFNVLSNNTDDHNKNFSFLLEREGSWHLAPAYDVTFIFNPLATGPNISRRLSAGGKLAEITKADLLDFARTNGIKNSNALIRRVAGAVSKFPDYAEKEEIPQPWRGIIQNTLNNQLSNFGYGHKEQSEPEVLKDQYGRICSNFEISVNSKE